VFDPAKSSTFQKSSRSTWKISYGDGSSASGNVGTDTINVGGLIIKNQAVELAKDLSSQFVSNTGDGLLGLAFGNINTVKPRRVRTPVENMIAQGAMSQSARLFTAHLGSSKEAGDQSFYTFGFIDESAVQASGQQISYTPIDNSSGFWMFNSTSVTVNGQIIPRSGNAAIADTGTTLALIDDSACEAIYAAIPGAIYDSSSQGYIFPDNINLSDLPTITLAVGSAQFAIHKDALGFAEAKPGYVYGGIQSRGDLTFDILGDTFLKGIYAVSFLPYS
jgi:Eukaryotic aspartyl protease